MLLTTAIVVLCAIGFVAVDADMDLREMKEGDVSHVPDRDNPVERAEMECTACLSTSREILAALRKVGREFKHEPSKLREYHLLTAVSNLCDDTTLHMGLIRQADGRVSTMFANENTKGLRQKFAIIKGAWVSGLWRQVCFDTVDRLEDDLFKIYKDDGRTYEFCPQLCKGSPQSATNLQKFHDEL